MPRRCRGNIGRRSRNATRQRNVVARRTEEERDIEREIARSRMIENRARLSEEAREAYNVQQRLRRRDVRARLSEKLRLQRAAIERQRRQKTRYNSNIKYGVHPSESPNSNHFLQHIEMYNDCFQITSFGGEVVNKRNYNATCQVPYKEEIEEDVEEAYIKWESETPEPSCSQASDGSCSEIQESVSAPQPSGIPNDPPNHNTTFTEVVEMKSDPGDMYDVWLKSLTLQVKELAKISPFRAYDAIYKFQSYVADNMLAVMKEKEGHLQPSCSTSFLNQKS